MTITAWFMDNSDEDQRLPHKTTPVQVVSPDFLTQLGVLHWSNIAGEDDPKLTQIKAERGYSYTDTCTVAPGQLPNYETKIQAFYEEHIHYDEEIRYCLDGSGYFDVRDRFNKWIRIHLEKGDMIILPEGIYHRFTTDSNNYIKAVRLFVGEPVWTPYNRKDIDEKQNASRQKYLARFQKQEKRSCGLTEAEMIEMWGLHCKYEFVDHDVPGTMSTMTDSPFNVNIPTMMGGGNHAAVTSFYINDFVHSNPADIKVEVVSTTVGDRQLVEENILSFTHNMPIPWMLPNIAPTGKSVRVPLVVIVGFSDGKVCSEHIHWDQASVLHQVGLLEKTELLSKCFYGQETSECCQHKIEPLY